MSDTYGTRRGPGERSPSGGVLSKPIKGMGRLPPGTHTVEVLSCVRTERAVSFIGQAVDGDCHAEVLEFLPHEIREGMKVSLDIQPFGGYVVDRSAGQYRARDPETGQALGDWTSDIGDLWAKMTARGLRPATTSIKEIWYGDASYRPISVHDHPTEADRKSSPNP